MLKRPSATPVVENPNTAIVICNINFQSTHRCGEQIFNVSGPVLQNK